MYYAYVTAVVRMCTRDYTAATATAAQVRVLRASQKNPSHAFICITVANLTDYQVLRTLQRATILAVQFRFSNFTSGTPTLSPHKARTLGRRGQLSTLVIIDVDVLLGMFRSCLE